MYAYIQGKVTYRFPTYVIIESNGVGYHLNISLTTYADTKAGEEKRLWTYLHVKEDILSLYGFSTEKERSIFIKLIAISGIGPNTALIVLSSMTTTELRHAIIAEDVNAFKKVKGVGPKTARRLIIELKDTFMKESDDDSMLITAKIDNRKADEALSALIALGFNKAKVQKLVSQALIKSPELSVEDLIKATLKQFS